MRLLFAIYFNSFNVKLGIFYIIEQKGARDKYRNLSEENRNNKREYWRNRYHNMSEEEV